MNTEANIKRICNVEQCFGNSGQPLAIPGRYLVGEGVLTKICRKKPKPRQFFLFNDILVYGTILINKKKYNGQHIIQLENVNIQPVDNDGIYEHGWQIISPSKSFTVYAATSLEKSEWISHINKCVNDLINKYGRKMAEVEPSPVWVPDNATPTCMHCRKSEFTILNRRHHCRKCGIVCCSACAGKKALIPAQSNKPVRVCLTCYNKLHHSREDVSSQQQPISNLQSSIKKEDSSGAITSDDESSASDTELPPIDADEIKEPPSQPTFY